MPECLKRLWKKLGSIKLEHDMPELFVKSQYDGERGPSLWYVIYRCVCSLDHLLWVLLAFFVTDSTMPQGFPWKHKGYFFIFLTDWGLMLQATDTTLQAVLVVKEFIRRKKGGGVQFLMPGSYRASWLIEGVNTGIAPLITLVYWTCLHKPGSGVVSALNFHEHTMNGIYILINLCITARPIHLIQFVYVVAFGLFYIFFSLMYYAGGGLNNYNWERYIYPILDWSKPGMSILFIFIAFVVIFVIYLAAFGISKLRVWVYERINHKHHISYSGSPMSTLESVRT